MKRLKFLFVLFAISLSTIAEAQTIPVVVTNASNFTFTPTEIQIKRGRSSSSLNERILLVDFKTIDSSKYSFNENVYTKYKFQIEGTVRFTIALQAQAYDSNGHVVNAVFNQILSQFGLAIDTSRPIEY